MTRNSYADVSSDLREVLHGAARLHVRLARMEGVTISTRGWSYNRLVDGIVALAATGDAGLRQFRSLATLFDTLDGVSEIGARAVDYLHDLSAIAD